jgi:hypothetical protein
VSKTVEGWNLEKKKPTYVLLLKCQLPNQREKIFAEIGSAHEKHFSAVSEVGLI